MELSICVQMKGYKCALQFCDFWNDELQICSLALESKLRAEILTTTLEQVKSVVSYKEEAESLQKLTRLMNFVEGTQTKQ